MKIVSLSESNLKEAIHLTEIVFHPNPDEFDAPHKWLPASLHPQEEKSKKLYATTKCTYVKYYVGIEKRKVAGITGLFLTKGDNDSVWLAWYAVSPKFRGHGLGKKLLRFTINKAKAIRKKYLRLYTSPNKDLESAMHLYKKFGFKVTTGKRFGRKHVLYLKKDLK